MKSRSIDKAWRAAPLPTSFHGALESGDWLRALDVYLRHPYHAPPADTYDLLTAVMHATGVGVDDVKHRFNEKMRLSSILQRKTAEEVEWGAFWEALNKGDGKTIGAAISGAHVSSVAEQIAVAEACAVLLKSAGERWEEKLIEDVPFATVTRSNLTHVALKEQRWDVALELMRRVRLTRSDVAGLWPLMEQFSWEKVLAMISACPKNSVPYHKALPHILREGCDLQTLSEHLEHARVLGDVDVVAPLLTYAVDTKDWDYVDRCVEHLVDIGQITAAARRVFAHLCQLHGHQRTCQHLREHRVNLTEMTMENLEQLKL